MSAAAKSRTGLWVDDCLRHRRDLTHTERLLIAQITGLSRDGRTCFASNEYLARMLPSTSGYIANALSRLSHDGIVRIVTVPDPTSANGRRRYLRVATLTQWPEIRPSRAEASKQGTSQKSEPVPPPKCEPPPAQNVKCHARDPYSAEKRVLDNSGGGESCVHPPRMCECAHEDAAAAAVKSKAPEPAKAPEPPVIALPATDPEAVALLADFLGEPRTAAELAGTRPADEIKEIIRDASRPGINRPKGLVIAWLRRGDPPPDAYLKAKRQALDRGDGGPVSTAPKLYVSLNCPTCHESRSLACGTGVVITCHCGSHWREGADGQAELLSRAAPRVDDPTAAFMAEMQAIRRAERAAAGAR